MFGNLGNPLLIISVNPYKNKGHPSSLMACPPIPVLYNLYACLGLGLSTCLTPLSYSVLPPPLLACPWLSRGFNIRVCPSLHFPGERDVPYLPFSTQHITANIVDAQLNEEINEEKINDKASHSHLVLTDYQELPHLFAIDCTSSCCWVFIS